MSFRNLWHFASWRSRSIVSRKSRQIHKAIGREVRLMTRTYTEEDVRTAHITAVLHMNYATEPMPTEAIAIFDRDTLQTCI